MSANIKDRPQLEDCDVDHPRRLQGLHPSGVVCTTIVLCPPGEEVEAKDSIAAALDVMPFDHLTSYVMCGEDDASAKWGPQRLFVPHRAAAVGSARPLIAIHALKQITRWKLWGPILGLLIILGVGLPMIGTREGNEDYYWSFTLSGMGIIFVALTIQCSMYSREIVFNLLGTFEFWFLAGQVIIVTGCTSFFFYKEKGDWYSIPLRVMSDFVSCLAAFTIDAASVDRRAKGVIMGIISVGLAIWAYLWNRDRSTYALYRIDMKVFDITVRSLAQSCLATLAAFCMRYCIACLFMRHDAMMLRFAPRLVRLEDVHSPTHPHAALVNDSFKSGGLSPRTANGWLTSPRSAQMNTYTGRHSFPGEEMDLHGDTVAPLRHNGLESALMASEFYSPNSTKPKPQWNYRGKWRISRHYNLTPGGAGSPTSRQPTPPPHTFSGHVANAEVTSGAPSTAPSRVVFDDP